jgi:inhibitor of cysteine peptidase
MKPKSLVTLICLSLVLAACVPVPVAPLPPAQAQPTEPPAASMASGLAAVQSVEVQVLDGSEVTLLVIARGNFPDGCTSIDETSWVQEGDKFLVTITTVWPEDAMCTQALVPFEETVMIEPESPLAAGTYTVDVNGVSTEVTL